MEHVDKEADQCLLERMGETHNPTQEFWKMAKQLLDDNIAATQELHRKMQVQSADVSDLISDLKGRVPPIKSRFATHVGPCHANHTLRG